MRGEDPLRYAQEEGGVAAPPGPLGAVRSRIRSDSPAISAAA